MSLGDLPDYADEKELDRPWAELSSFCAEHGVLSGLFLIDRKGEGCHLAGLYVLPGFRGGRTAAALIDRSIRAAGDRSVDFCRRPQRLFHVRQAAASGRSGAEGDRVRLRLSILRRRQTDADLHEPA